MARRASDNNSANSQFFLMLKETSSLSGEYTVVVRSWTAWTW